MTARSCLNLGITAFMALAFTGLALAEPPTNATAPANKQSDANLMVAQAIDLNRPENEEPRPSRRGLLTIQAALDPSPARLGAGHSAESSPR